MKAQLLIAAAVSFLTFAGFSAGAQAPQQYNSLPGIAVAGSQDYDKIPEKARHFIAKHFKGVSVTKCEQYFAEGKYEVELSNGVDIDFNNDGEVLEIDAPDNAVLDPALVKDLLHDTAFHRLAKDGVNSKVESIEFKKGKVVEVEVMIPDPDTYIFVVDGDFIGFDD